MATAIDHTTALECLLAECGPQVRSSMNGGLRRFSVLLQEHLGLQEQEATQVVNTLEKRELIAWVGNPSLPPCPNILDLSGVWVLRRASAKPV